MVDIECSGGHLGDDSTGTAFTLLDSINDYCTAENGEGQII